MMCRECDTVYTGPIAGQWICEQCGCANWDGSVANMSKVLAVDFDGVIHKYSRGWEDGRIYDVPMDGAILGMKKLQHQGWHLIIFTVREDLEAVKEWMINWWPTEACLVPHHVMEDRDSAGNLKTRVTALDHVGKVKLRFCTDHPIPQATNRKPGAHAYIDDRAFRFEDWGGVLNEFVK